MEIMQIVEYVFYALFMIFVFLTACIDIKNRKIEKSVLSYGIVISLMYIAYSCIFEKVSIYKYAIYVILYVLILILDTISLKRFAKNSYINGILLTFITMGIFTKGYVLLKTTIITLLSIGIYLIINKLKKLKHRSIKKDEQFGQKVKIAFILCVSNIVTMLGTLYIENFVL